MKDYITCRGGYYYYVRRVPAKLAKYDPRKTVRISLETTVEAEARDRSRVYNAMIERFWRDIITKAPPAEGIDAAYRDAVAAARVYGFSYRSLEDLIAPSGSGRHDVAELVERARAINSVPPGPHRSKVEDALLGGVGKPGLRMSQVLEKYWPLSVDRQTDKDKSELRKWRNPRIRAVKHFIEACGDISFVNIDRAQVLKLRTWLAERIEDEEILPQSANKDFMHMRDIIDTVALSLQLPFDVDILFSKVRFKGVDSTRQPFTPEFVQGEILKAGRLDSLNADARAILYMMTDTGARPKELVRLEPGDIVLDAEIPYINIRRRKKAGLKSKASERQIPLVGAALYGARMVPTGVSRYSQADSVSNLINQFMTDNKLRPSDDHSLYSLRHTFKDRMRMAGFPPELQDELMGHAGRGMGAHYGAGYTLAAKKEWMDKIAFKPPK